MEKETKKMNKNNNIIVNRMKTIEEETHKRSISDETEKRFENIT